MKKSLIALAVFGAFAGVAHADAGSSSSSLTVYGDVDLGLTKASVDAATKMAQGDWNRLGFKGVEDLGGNFKAFFTAEMQFNPQDGGVQVNRYGSTSPLFQGETTAGLEGVFGKFRFGRAYTATQDTMQAFDAWGNKFGRGSFQQNIMDADYYSNPLNATKGTGVHTNAVSYNGGEQRFAKAVFYNSPVFAGIQINATVATKENGTSPDSDFATAQANPYSISATWGAAGFNLGLGYEANALKDNLGLVGVSYDFGGLAKIMASYSQKGKNTNTWAQTPEVKAAQIGAAIKAGPGEVLLGYGEKKADAMRAATASKLKQAAIGYQYGISKRTYVYADYVGQKITGSQYNWMLTAHDGTQKTSNNTFDIGLHHSF